MAVVSMMRIPGDTDELIAKMREHIVPVGERVARKHGGLGTIVARTPDGILAINIWENEEGRHAMAEDPEIRSALAAAGFPAPAFDAYEIAEMRILEEALTARV
ncbi:MAG TPA: hypothetical protein VFB17_06580 [Gaiellaceae bacterium]|nr:hypothetical protein [Gaiellaceae bacterium]